MIKRREPNIKQGATFTRFLKPDKGDMRQREASIGSREFARRGADDVEKAAAIGDFGMG